MPINYQEIMERAEARKQALERFAQALAEAIDVREQLFKLEQRGTDLELALHALDAEARALVFNDTALQFQDVQKFADALMNPAEMVAKESQALGGCTVLGSALEVSKRIN
jgi:hypothetical protein